MRLLNARTYELQTFLGKDKPNYAILSHTWEDGEVLFEDIQNTSKIDWTAKKGYFKIKKTCDQALEDGCDFVWIDTCNINKDSSSELSEAINSMFNWYRDATICYAYISDIKAVDGWSFSGCRWFTRGWTLQEVIAPNRVHFYDRDWCHLGSRISLAKELSGFSGIDELVLLRRDYSGKRPNKSVDLVYLKIAHLLIAELLDDICYCCNPTGSFEGARSMLDKFSVAQKMRWASKRTTTREEDIAYCLMGLFDVNMPLLYGEGSKAFFRLQKAILEMRSDHTIFAFRSYLSNVTGLNSPRFLAPDPTVFCDDVWSIHTPAHATHTSLLGTTLSIDMLLCPVIVWSGPRHDHLGILDCSMAGDPHARPAILLSAINGDRTMFRCTAKTNNLFLLHSSRPGKARAMIDTTSQPDIRMSIPTSNFMPRQS
ncbi:hypothetical protein IG631_11494 [Alternaria alternata]|nr:hypothetical protein IG631_11494 [Alternaria alternata]